MKHRNIAFFIPHLGCKHRCSFCEQRSISGEENKISADEVFETASKELETLSETERKDTEIAFFGGSFTAIEREKLLSFLKVGKSLIEKYSIKGIRISTRPDALSEEILDILKEYGVSDIEIGAQSTDAKVLLLNDRGHTREDIFVASEKIKKYGFGLGLQIMPGLFGDTKETIEKTVADVLKIKPDTLRVYPTLVVRGTKLEKLYNEKIFTPLTLEDAAEICSKMLEPMEDSGIEIIKMGLHSEKSLEENLVAGPYHPSFKEICESRLFCDKIEDEMNKRNLKSADVFVSPKSISKALGNRRENLEKLSKKGLKINVKIYENLSKYEIKIGKE
jgi:histone acetyltransferase (RNA polymerase elongator complex component)